MSWNPNQPQDPNQQGQYGGYQPPPANNPYGAQQGGYQQGGQYGSNQQPPYGQQQYGGSQQPPYGQQQYGGYQQPPPYGQQQYGGNQQAFSDAAAALGPTSMGMQANVAAGLSYLFGWIGGLIFFFGEKQNRFVRFNAMQSILLSGGLTVLYIVLWMLDFVFLVAFIGALAFIFGCLFWLVGLAAFVLWIVLLINAFQGKYFKLPVIGDLAEKYANPTVS